MSSYDSDQSANIDLLGRETFVSQLADVILDVVQDSAFTISVEGKWGYGKSSVFYFVKEKLREDTNLILVDFNPWLVGNADTLTENFLVTLANEVKLDVNGEKENELAQKLEDYAEVISLSKHLGVFVDLGIGVPGLGSVVGATSTRISSFMSRISKGRKEQASKKSLESLASKKQEIATYISESKLKIVVFIDDIDRLTPKEAFEVLRVVKTVADFKQVCFVLAYDPQYLKPVLKHNNIENSEEYLDKIVQLRVNLPRIHEYNLSLIFESEASRLFQGNLDSTEQYELQEIFTNYLIYFFSSPREIKRLFNNFRFVYQQVSSEVRLYDIMALSAISMISTPLYKHIREHPGRYTGQSNQLLNSNLYDYDGKEEEVFLEQKVEILKGISLSKRWRMEQLLHSIFPYLLDKKIPADGDKLKRVCIPERLDAALNFEMPKHLISQEQLDSFLSAEGMVSGQKVDFVINVIDRNQEARLFSYLEQQVISGNQHSSIELINIIITGVLKSEKGKEQISKRSLLYFTDLVQLTAQLIKEILLKLEANHEQLKEALNEIMKISANVAFVTESFLYRFRDIESSTNEQDKQLFSKIKEDIFTRVLEIIHSEEFSDSNIETYLYYALYRYDKERIKEYVTKLFLSSKKECIYHAINLICYAGADTSIGAYFKVDSLDSLFLKDQNTNIQKIAESLLSKDEHSPKEKSSPKRNY